MLQRHRLVWLAPAAWSALRRDVQETGAVGKARDAAEKGEAADGAEVGGTGATGATGATGGTGGTGATGGAGRLAKVGEAGDAMAQAALDHWAARGLPLVVTRQSAGSGSSDSSSDSSGDDGVALGLPAPLRWQRRRLALRVPHAAVQLVGDFPAAGRAAELLPAPQRAGWSALCRALAASGCAARVYGSHGWQLISGLDHLHADSDLDLLLPVGDAAGAAAVCDVLAAAPSALPRLDGELLFPGGAAVAWREWQRARCAPGGVAGRSLLVKRLHGAALEAWPSVADIAHRVGRAEVPG